MLQKILLTLILQFLVIIPRAQAYIDLSVSEAISLINTEPGLVILDVREPNEHCSETGHIPNALNYPYLSEVLQARYTEFHLSDPILVVCQSGHRSDDAAGFLDSKEFTSVYNMTEGMSAWTGEIADCSACPAETLLGQDLKRLQVLRKFRDNVLMKNTAGRTMINSYYRSAETVNTLFTNYPILILPAAALLKALIPAIDALQNQNYP